jgi:hypothetical protein
VRRTLALALALAGIGGTPAVGTRIGPRVAVTPAGAVAVDGRPTFLIGAGWLSPESVPRALALGVNTFVSRRPGRREIELVRAVGHRGFVVPDFAATGPHDSLPQFFDAIGWALEDEPDGNAVPPADLPDPGAVAQLGKAIFLTLSPAFLRPGVPAGSYAPYLARADVVLTDPYPLAHGCADPAVASLRADYDAALALGALAAGRPKAIGEWIETGPIEGYCGPSPVAPEQASAEAWAAVAGGAKVIAWFTHSWRSGVEDELDLTPAMAAAIAATDAELQRFAPVLLSARRAGIDSQPDDPIKVGLFVRGGRVYLLAVNVSAAAVSLADDQAAADWRARLPGLAGQSVAELTTGASAGATEAGLDDTLPPFGHRLYTWVLADR